MQPAHKQFQRGHGAAFMTNHLLLGKCFHSYILSHWSWCVWHKKMSVSTPFIFGILYQKQKIRKSNFMERQGTMTNVNPEDQNWQWLKFFQV